MGKVKSAIDAMTAGTKIGRANLPTSFTALLEGKDLAKMGIAIRKLENQKDLSARDTAILKSLKAKQTKLKEKQAKEVPPKSDRPKNKKQPSKPDMSMAMKDGGMPMVKKDGKKIPAFAADGVGKMMKGGMAKKKKAMPGYAYGGMASAKPRTGNTDYRMGGMFMKNGKK
jgi:hypothetical protein|tara:strand:- start:159 stop:668 length:510 start_codon:yes stop_codon:yes gene_type:complete